VFTEFFFGNIGVGKANVINLAFIFRGSPRRAEGARNITDVDVVSLEVALEQNDETVMYGPIVKSFTSRSRRMRGDMPKPSPAGN